MTVRPWVPHPRHPLATPPAPYVEDPVSVIRRCILEWEASLGITTARAPRERALIREMRDACNTIEGKPNQEPTA